MIRGPGNVEQDVERETAKETVEPSYFGQSQLLIKPGGVVWLEMGACKGNGAAVDIIVKK